MRARSVWVALVAGLMVASAVPSHAETGGSPGVVCSPWKGVAPQGSSGLMLTDVTAVSRTLAWAVGSYSGAAPPEIWRWAGTTWTKERVNPPRGEWLNGVAAISATDAWAIGYTKTITPLAVHWDGTAWSVVPTPQPGSYHYMYDIDGAAPDDVWAVGNYSDPQGFIHPLALHWDGTAWSVAAVPEAPLGNNIFYAVDAVATDDVWAVGIRGDGPFQFQPLIEHWDGSAWSVAQFVPPAGDDNQLFGVSATSSDDAWAVGVYGLDAAIPLFEHWDGTAWTQVDGPPQLNIHKLLDVNAVSPIDAWAVGLRTLDQRPFTMHWDGTRWSVVPVPHPEGMQVAITAVSASSAGDVWTVGYYLPPGSTDYPLTMHNRGCR